MHKEVHIPAGELVEGDLYRLGEGGPWILVDLVAEGPKDGVGADRIFMVRSGSALCHSLHRDELVIVRRYAN